MDCYSMRGAVSNSPFYSQCLHFCLIPKSLPQPQKYPRASASTGLVTRSFWHRDCLFLFCTHKSSNEISHYVILTNTYLTTDRWNILFSVTLHFLICEKETVICLLTTIKGFCWVLNKILYVKMLCKCKHYINKEKSSYGYLNCS